MELINFLIDNYQIPLLSALMLGLLSSLSPCTLAANVAAVAYISRELNSPRQIIINSVFYAVGRAVSYSLIGMAIYFGANAFLISNIFEGWGVLVLGPILIVGALIMLDLIKIKFIPKWQGREAVMLWLANRGHVGALALGVILALAFCPYSAILFFGILIPLAVNSSEGALLPTLFGLGTALPVMIFAIVIAFSVNQLASMFNLVKSIEKIARRVVAGAFLIVGIYYCQYLVKYLIQLLN